MIVSSMVFIISIARFNIDFHSTVRTNTLVCADQIKNSNLIMHPIRHVCAGVKYFIQFHLCLMCCLISFGTCWLPSRFPDYCSKNMIERSIQPLTSDELLLVSELQQVQVVIRHGSRTPISSNSCWRGYNADWHNCRETQTLDAQHTQELKELPLQIDVKYDTNGNCKPGKLLPEGYIQEQVNGEILREAYLDNSSGLKLFNDVQWSQINQSQLFLFSDDTERTMLSGQVVVSSTFDIPVTAVLKWSVGDYLVDASSCPVLGTMYAEAAQSSAFRSMNGSEQTDLLTQRLSSLWGDGQWSWNLALDCLMTSVCSSREVPGAPSDGELLDPMMMMTQELLDGIIARDELHSSFFLGYGDSIIAKTSSNKLARQLRSHLLQAVRRQGAPAATKFALFSAHDSNLMALLTMLAPSQWGGRRPPYASMLAVELYSAAKQSARQGAGLNVVGSDIEQPEDAEFYFRLLYNGKPLLVSDCGSPLCDIRVLLGKLQYATNDDDVCMQTNAEGYDDKPSSVSSSDMQGLELLFSLSFSLLMGCLIGATSMYFATKRTGSYGSYQSVTVADAEVDSDSMGLEMNTVE